MRATGSGAGCGNTWPTCDGEIIPLASSTELIIELSHRLTSALFGVAVMALVIVARRTFSPGDRVRRLAWLTLILTGVEGLLGAGLVRFDQVADNADISRAFWISGHLVNTLLLLAAAFATAWFASHREVRWSRVPGMIVAGAAALLIVAMSGAITALGDTLFPADSFVEGLRAELSPTASVFERLRLAHPVLAVAAGVAIIALVRVRDGTPVGRSGRHLVVLVGVQLAAGVVNVALAAPVWMQVVHLLLADLVWLAYLRYGFEAATTAAAPLAVGP